MAKFSSIYKQTSPTIRTVQGENTFEKGMYWTNSVIEQGYVHTLLNYDIDALNGTLTVANGFSTCEFAHGGSFVDRLTFGDENSKKILVTQPRNEYLLEAFEGVTNIISVSKITVKNNQHLEEAIHLQGFTPENVSCYKLLLYNPVNYRFIVVTMLQASRDKYFIINDKYQLRRLSANPICCGRSDGKQVNPSNHGITDYYIPRYLRNNYRSTFSQELYDNRFMQTVPTCEGYGNKSFCFVKHNMLYTRLNKQQPKPINGNTASYPTIKILDPKVPTSFIGNFATGILEDTLEKVDYNIPVDQRRYGALMTCCYIVPSKAISDAKYASMFYYPSNRILPDPINEESGYEVVHVTNVMELGNFITETNKEDLTVDLLTGALSGPEFCFGLLPRIHYPIDSNDPGDSDINLFLQYFLRNTDKNSTVSKALYSSIFRSSYISGSLPSSWLSNTIIKNLIPGQCLRVAAYCTSKKVENPGADFTKYPNYTRYLEGPVKAVYVLNYTWNGFSWDFTFVNTSDFLKTTPQPINPQILTKGSIANWQGATYTVHLLTTYINKLLYTDFVNKQNLSNRCLGKMEEFNKDRYVGFFDTVEGTVTHSNGLDLDLDLELAKLSGSEIPQNIANNSLVQDTQQATFEIIPKKLLPSEAALWGYNMLLDNPYNFLCNWLSGSKTAYFTGLLLKDAQDLSKVLINALLNTPSVLELYFNSDFEYFKNNAKPTYQLRVEYKNPTDDWRILRDYTTAETERLLSESSPIRIDFTGVDEVTIFRATITDTDPEKAITVPNAAGTETETTYLIVHQSLYTVSYTPDRSKLNQSPENFDLGTATGLTFWKGRLVAWGVLDADNILFLSEPNDPSYFAYPNSVDTFEENIIHCVTYSDALLVFTNTKLWRLDMNVDGLSWNKTLLQQNLRLKEEDIPYVTIIKNMLFFKSGNQFYMLVPSNSSMVGELNIAPISNTIRDFLKDPFENIRELLETIYPDLSAKNFTYGSQGAKDTTGNFIIPTQHPITKYLVKYGTHVEKTKIFVDWWFDLAEFKEQRTDSKINKIGNQAYLLVQLIYDTATYGWTMQTHFTNTIGCFLSDVANEDVEFVNLLLCPAFSLNDKILNPTWGVSISKRVEPKENVLKYFSYNIKNYNSVSLDYLNAGYNRLQILDTGYKEVTTPALKKRFREIQLMFEADADNNYGLQALYEFSVDGHSLLSATKQDICLKDKLDYTGTLIGKELQIVDSLNIFEEGPENLLGNRLDNTFMLDFTALTGTKKVKIRKQVNGKGYLARAKFTNVTPAKYRITNYAFISHNKNTK